MEVYRDPNAQPTLEVYQNQFDTSFEALSQIPKPPADSPPAWTWAQQHPLLTTPGAHELTIFGMRRVTFVLSALLALAVVVAAVGGGVGGTMAVQNARK